MNKTQKMKQAAHYNRKRNFKQWCKKALLFPWNLCKKVWRFIVRMCKKIWNWLKSIDIIGMINLTLLVAIIVLFTSLIVNFNNKYDSKTNSGMNNTEVVVNKQKTVDTRKVVKRKTLPTLPLKVNAKTGIKPQIKTVGVEKPQVVKHLSVPAKELPKQKIYGDVIVDIYPNSPVLFNGVKIDGNLFIQNVRKYTLPCGAKIRGNLFIRNVEKLSFCGDFTVQGNIYVSPYSSFGPIPSTARIDGQVIL